MDVFSITDGRQKLGELVKRVKYERCTIALGQHGKPEVLLVAYPLSQEESSMAAMNAQSKSFDFLSKEPDLYSRADLTKRYV